jgi:hypothetical protein
LAHAEARLHAPFKGFPDGERTLPTAIISQASAFGVILAVLALNFLVISSWHWARRTRHRRHVLARRPAADGR